MMTLLKRLKRYLFSADLEEAEYQRIKNLLQESNRNNLWVFCLVSIIFLTVMLVLSFFIEGVASNRPAYAISVVLVVILSILNHMTRERGKLLLVLIYTFMGIILGFGVIIGTITSPGQLTATFIALLLTVPLLFTDRPIRMMFLIILTVIVFAISAKHTKPSELYSLDILNSIIYGSISVIVSSYMMKVKAQRYLFEDRMRFVSETDQLTGLKNRNCYEQRLKAYEKQKYNSFFCIYIDVNGLHELNNAKGHEAGDEMLKFVANALQEQFGDKDTYRIGGDEYVAFGYNIEEAAMQRKLQYFSSQIRQEGYFAAVGVEYVQGKDFELSKLVRQAEKKMYDDKRAYYQLTGNDRRKR